MTTPKRFAVFDSDSHVVEPRDVWEKYLEPEYRVLGKHALWREDGRTTSYLKVNGEIFRDTMNPNIPRHAIWRPGMTWDAVGELDPQTRHAMHESAWEPQARLRDMDAMGVAQALLSPTWFAEGFHLVHDPDVAYALARAYNNWIADFCQAAPDRLFAAAMVPLGHPLAPVLSYWLDNHMFVASTLIGFTVMQRYPRMKVVVAHGKASWMEEVLEKMEASTRVIPLLHTYPVRTDPEEMWEEGHVMLGFDAEERLIQKLPHDFAAKVVWGSRYPHHDTTSAWDAIAMLTQANVPESLMARMLGGNAAQQFGIELVQKVGA
jgi:predicted TIM-barrel fold metal-dependent hydrolase